MDMQKLKELIYKGEKVNVECKKAQNSIPDSVYETYSSFANTKGGTIVLGVDEDKTKTDPKLRFIICGINNPEKLREDFGILSIAKKLMLIFLSMIMYML